jgi:hypothetical protein
MPQKPDPPKPPPLEELTPKGNNNQMKAAKGAFQRFGCLLPAAMLEAETEIDSIAFHYNSALHPSSRGPSKAQVIKELTKIENAARELSSGLEGLHFVSLDYLLGSAPPLSPLRHRPKRSLDYFADENHAWQGPMDLQQKKPFTDNFERVFAQAMTDLAESSTSSSADEHAKIAAANEQRYAATSKLERESARRVLSEIKPTLDPRRDLVRPLALQMLALKEMTSAARDELEKQWPKPRTGRVDELALMSPQHALAQNCWALITELCGREGFDLIKCGDGLFADFVRSVGAYATGKYPDDGELSKAIKDTVDWGKQLVEHYEDTNRDYFASRP